MPNDTLSKVPFGAMYLDMERVFRKALMWHIDQNGTTIADLVRGSGVSRDVINKLKARPDSSTDVENAIAIARYYGKSVEQFLRMDNDSSHEIMARLVDLLTEDEARILHSQVRGILTARAAQAK